MALPCSQGVTYTKALHTGWKPKLQHRRMTLPQHQDVSTVPASAALSVLSSSASAALKRLLLRRARIFNQLAQLVNMIS